MPLKSSDEFGERIARNQDNRSVAVFVDSAAALGVDDTRVAALAAG